jgi:hypothetical protein
MFGFCDNIGTYGQKMCVDSQYKEATECNQCLIFLNFYDFMLWIELIRQNKLTIVYNMSIHHPPKYF